MSAGCSAALECAPPPPYSWVTRRHPERHQEGHAGAGGRLHQDAGRLPRPAEEGLPGGGAHVSKPQHLPLLALRALVRLGLRPLQMLAAVVLVARRAARSDCGLLSGCPAGWHAAARPCAALSRHSLLRPPTHPPTHTPLRPAATLCRSTGLLRWSRRRCRRRACPWSLQVGAPGWAAYFCGM